jgi:hypothetical protein
MRRVAAASHIFAMMPARARRRSENYHCFSRVTPWTPPFRITRRRVRVKTLSISILAGLLVLGSERPSAAQLLGVRVEGGLVQDHGVLTGAGAFHVIRAFDTRQLNRLEVGFFADPYVFSADAGVDIRAPIASRRAFLLRAGGGMIFEPDWKGLFLRLGVGIEWRLSPAVAMALTVQTGVHGHVPGPHRIMVGLEHGFRSK